MRVSLAVALFAGVVAAVFVAGRKRAFDCDRLRAEMKEMHIRRADAEAAGDADQLADANAMIEQARWEWTRHCSTWSTVK